MKAPPRWVLKALLCLATACATAQTRTPLIVVKRGGTPAEAYYRGLKLTPAAKPQSGRPPAPLRPFTEESALPAKSAQLSPGIVTKRSIQAPGLTPLFIVGNDARSRQWLREHYERLRTLGAAGIVVNVASLDELNGLRRLAPALLLSPSAGDDLAPKPRPANNHFRLTGMSLLFIT